ncbi:SAF domain-containing protein [Streptomyces sp. 4N509B]|uniref:SAF domain-containing protein n=1 Tax=Streptomyces sp. 4N509B TaxID=3457413 RepID=UPI003FD58CE7
MQVRSGPSGDALPPRGNSGRNGGAPGRLAGARRGRRVPHLLVGVLLVVGCAAGGVVWAAEWGQREPVLVLAHPVQAGQRLSAGDLREVSLAVEGGVAVLAAEEAGDVEGRVVAFSLPGGTLLTEELLGPAEVPGPGQAVAAVGLEAGQFPPQVQPGSSVLVVAAAEQDALGAPSTATGQAGTAGAGAAWSGVVAAVDGGGQGEPTVISLRMAEPDANALASVPAAEVRLVLVNGAAAGEAGS